MTRSKLVALLILALAFAPFAAAEEAVSEVTAEEPVECTSPVAAVDLSQEFVLVGALSREVPAGGELADCTATAYCWNGSQVTCSASGPTAQCSATDSNCPATRGSCWSSDEGTKYCPSCQCTAPPCSKYEGKSCSPNGAFSPECSAGGSSCAHCRCFGGTWGCP